MHTSFLLFTPHPDSSTVYTAMNNFINMLKQLDQNALSLFCDDGFYQIIVDIYLKCPEKFKQLIPCMGSFHMAKCVQHCIGKYMSRSVIEDAFLKQLLDKKIVQHFLNGTHYVRSLRAISISTDAINCQKWETFWKTHDIKKYKDLLPLLQAVYEKITAKPQKPYKKTFNLCKENLQNFRTIS